MNHGIQALFADTVKETIIELLREAGHDYMSAADWATKTIREFLDSGRESATYYIKGGGSFTLNRRAK